jgi:hypothetical protein
MTKSATIIAVKTTAAKLFTAKYHTITLTNLNFGRHCITRVHSYISSLDIQLNEFLLGVYIYKYN